MNPKSDRKLACKMTFALSFEIWGIVLLIQKFIGKRSDLCFQWLDFDFV